MRVIAIGSGAGNALNHIVRGGGLPADLISANTDAQDLRRSLAPTTLQLGSKLVRGLGCGGDAEVGRDAALEDRDAITAALDGADLVIVIAGLGGGTGSGAAPVVGQIAAELGARTVALVALPFPFEGRRRHRVAEEALEAVGAAAAGRAIVADIPVPPEREGRITMQELFARSDRALGDLARAAVDIAGGGTGGDALDPARLAELRRHLARPPPR